MSKILHVGPSNLPIGFPRGGAVERRMLELARAQVARGHEVTIATIGSEPVELAGVQLEVIKRRFAGPFGYLQFLAQALSSESARSAEIIHCHGAVESSLKRRSTLMVLSYDFFRFHGISKGWLHSGYRKLMDRFDLLLPVTAFCMRESLQYWKLPETKARIFSNGVNLQQFSPDSVKREVVRSKLGLGDAPTLLYVGRVCRQKGSDVLAAAYAQAKLSIPELRLLVAGPMKLFGKTDPDPTAAELIAAGATYLGAVDEGDLASVYNACDLFVMPTREDEMFGMAAVEAQACGKPVVASRLGGLPEVVSSGSFFDVGDSAALAENIVDFFRDTATTDPIKVREKVERFAWGRLAADLDTIYRVGKLGVE